MGSVINWVKLGIILLILLIGFVGGYYIGAWNKNKLELELQAITKASQLAEAKLAEKTQQLAVQLEKIKGDYFAQAKQNKQKFEQEREKLAKKLNDSERKLVDLSASLSSTNSKLTQIEDQLTTATGEHKEALAQQREVLIRQKNKFEQEKESWKCLDVLLPDFGGEL
jgi:biopolymer transport protein ExbD